MKTSNGSPKTSNVHFLWNYFIAENIFGKSLQSGLERNDCIKTNFPLKKRPDRCSIVFKNDKFSSWKVIKVIFRTFCFKSDKRDDEASLKRPHNVKKKLDYGKLRFDSFKNIYCNPTGLPE